MERKEGPLGQPYPWQQRIIVSLDEPRSISYVMRLVLEASLALLCLSKLFRAETSEMYRLQIPYMNQKTQDS